MATAKLTETTEDMELKSPEVQEVAVSEAPKAETKTSESPKKETKALFSSWEKAVQEELLLAKPHIERGNVEVVIHVNRHTPNAKEIRVPSLSTAVREMK